MARKKNYNEEEVIEKAMNLFWINGYKTTSMQMLEKEMGINKFSIYASFGNKDGVFLESLKCYQKKLNVLIENLKQSPDGIAGIKQYFYAFVAFSKNTEFGKGCLVTNTANELNDKADEKIMESVTTFTNQIKQLFAEKLIQERERSEAKIEEKADYLLLSMFGLSTATRVFNKNQIENYIENVFKNV